MVVEVVAGLAFGSMALLADGLHMASHAAALGLTVLAYIYCRRRAGDPRFAFGTGKVNSLGGYTSALLLVGFALYMAVESISRLMAPVPIAFDGAIAVAFVGLLVNGRIGVHPRCQARFAQFTAPKRTATGRSDTDTTMAPHHGHGHAHHDHNLRGAYLHVLADAPDLGAGDCCAGRRKISGGGLDGSRHGHCRRLPCFPLGLWTPARQRPDPP